VTHATLVFADTVLQVLWAMPVRLGPAYRPLSFGLDQLEFFGHSAKSEGSGLLISQFFKAPP
jgi:hypothetical protein